MSKAVEYIIDIVEKGEKNPILVKVDFVSNYCIREYNNLFSASTKVKSDWNEISDLSSEMAAIKIEKPEGYRERIAEIKQAIKNKTAGIIAIGGSDFLKRRFELIKRILTDNGITDERLMIYETWDEQIDPNDAMDFLTACIYKDIDLSKKH